MKRLADQTLYEILEVPPDASPEQIQAAYEKARALYGPGSIVTYTLIEPDEAALLEARIEDARGTLLDPERRARYDASLQERAEPRAAAGGSAAPSGGAPPPVIPALQPAPPPPATREAAPSPEASAPAERGPEPVSAIPSAPPTATAAPSAPPAASAAPIPPITPGPIEEAPPRPIQLDREVSPPPAPLAEPRAPAPAPAAAAEAAPAEPAAPPSAPGPVVPPPIPDAWTGEALRQVREARGLSIQAISERTKVTRHHIENIEGDRFASLPAQVYLRGILLSLARELRLDGQKVARSYLERIGGGAAPSPSQTKPR